MAVRSIVRFPDAGLRVAAVEVTAFDAALASLAADLLDTMRAAPGIGITAPHIGVPQRLAVIQLDPSSEVLTYVNPEIVQSSDDTALNTEGSVSMPGVTEEIARPMTVRVRYRTLSGDLREEDADGLLAVCLQHEIDQLDGLFWIQRLSRLKRERVVKRFEKLERNR